MDNNTSFTSPSPTQYRMSTTSTNNNRDNTTTTDSYIMPSTPTVTISNLLTSSSYSSTSLSAKNKNTNTTGALIPIYMRSRRTKGECASDDDTSADSGFIIRHFAGEVEYKIDGFIQKNNNSLQDDLLKLLATSTNTFLQDAMIGT